MRPSRRIGLAGLALALVAGWGCGGDPASDAAAAPPAAERSADPPPAPGSPAAPDPDLRDMEAQVAARFGTTRAAILEDPQSAAAWGEFARVAHAHELWEEALVAYEEAQRLDPSDERWPYFLGDVRSVIGTDLAGAARAFRRAL
ncbi:MAG: hypothetical protein AAFX50_06965, partial [Acidobacteriota bacterium]